MNDELNQHERAADELRRALADPALLPAAAAALRAALAAHEQLLRPAPPAALVDLGHTQAGDITIGDVAGRDLLKPTINLHTAAGPARAAFLAEYLRALAGACARLALADVASGNPGHAPATLSAVYTPLDVTSTVTATPAELRADPDAASRPLTALEVIARHPRLALLGDPGGGKSAVLCFLGLCLARTGLGEPGWLERLGPAWPHGPLTPIHIALRELGAWLATLDPAPNHGDAGLLWRFLTTRHDPELVAALRKQTAAGRTVLLLDGLDEAPAGPTGRALRLLRELLTALDAAVGPSRIVVTCRTLDYQGLRLAGWPAETLAALSPARRVEFIERWYAALAALERPLAAPPAVLRAGLLAAIAERDELRRLAGSPLLLTLMALLHTAEGRLPAERTRLYERSIELLLLRWRPERNAPPLRELLDLPRWGDDDLGRLLDRLAFVAHDRGSTDNEDAAADLPRATLLATAADFFAVYGRDRDVTRAQTLLNFVSAHSNGVLQQLGPDTYRFPHRSFQEYLAARRLASDEDWPDDEAEFVDRALRRADAGPQWREVLLLAAGRQAVLGRQVRPTAQLADELLRRRQQPSLPWCHDAALAGELLAEVGRERLGARHSEFWERARAALLAILGLLDERGEVLAPVQLRVRAALTLGRMGDPRYPVALADWRAELLLALRGDESGYLRPVAIGAPASDGGADDPDARAGAGPRTTAAAERPLWIARLPLTNEQWGAWAAAGGQELFTPAEGEHAPPNGPATRVTWAALADFCAWLNAGLADALPSGYVLRPPTEREWSAAAIGGDGRQFPWGDAWRDDRAATLADRDARGHRGAPPVGCYPAGAAPCGALDMAGGVWEWAAADTGPGRAAAHALRGGSHADEPEAAGCAARLELRPDYAFSFVGARLVLGPADGKLPES